MPALARVWEYRGNCKTKFQLGRLHSRKGDRLAKAMKRNSRIQWPVSFSLECWGKAETCRWSGHSRVLWWGQEQEQVLRPGGGRTAVLQAGCVSSEGLPWRTHGADHCWCGFHRTFSLVIYLDGVALRYMFPHFV